ncbi:MAG: SCP2 sterol-binding domain-containing protein [Candidatus Thermoplasmatota archaeon]|nr:SCP2 sterol-binding domain-containing protein [Candidatus Thermoplasmatota archaeon]MCL5731012.1 SCP2 sterol-binding domain-containing protein [Candidatus Thermoplasmatota archaeon]
MSFREDLVKIVGAGKENPELRDSMQKLNKSFVFRVGSEQPFTLVLNTEKLDVIDGELPGSSATISASDDVLSAIFSGSLDPIKAFMSGQMKVTGDVFSAQKLTEIAKKARK